MFTKSPTSSCGSARMHSNTKKKRNMLLMNYYYSLIIPFATRLTISDGSESSSSSGTESVRKLMNGFFLDRFFAVVSSLGASNPYP